MQQDLRAIERNDPAMYLYIFMGSRSPLSDVHESVDRDVLDAQRAPTM